MSSTALPFHNLKQRTQYYLQGRDFGMTMLSVVVLHVMVVAAILLWPKPDVLEIPVRTLDITLGAPQAMPDLSAAAPTAKPVEKVQPPEPAPKSEPAPKVEAAPEEAFAPPPAAPKPKPVKKEAVKPKPVVKKETPKRVKISERRTPKQQSIPVPKQVTLPNVPARPVAPASNDAPTEQLDFGRNPYQYVRQPTGSVTPQGTPDAVLTNAAAETIRARYEQKISAWLEKHRVSSSTAKKLGQHGTAIVRVRMDRNGKVRYYAIDRSSGFQLIDEAAMKMVRRADPFPAPPSNYPDKDRMEFLFPIPFTLD